MKLDDQLSSTDVQYTFFSRLLIKKKVGKFAANTELFRVGRTKMVEDL